MQSFKKKVVTLLKEGLEPLEEGIINFKTQKEDIEYIANERLNKCLKCHLFKREPIPMLRVKDNSLPEASEMFCDDCGCTLSYKLRQSIVKCSKWDI